MMTKARPLLATLLALVLLLGASPSTRAAAPPSEGPAQAIGRTPPRLSYTNGEVSFFRPGAQDWASAQANTPLAPGDELYTSTQGDLELQVGTRAFVRAWGDTRSEEHTSELQSQSNLVCRLLLEKKKRVQINEVTYKEYNVKT